MVVLLFVIASFLDFSHKAIYLLQDLNYFLVPLSTLLMHFHVGMNEGGGLS